MYKHPTPTIEQALRELDSTTNQTWIRKRKGWAAVIRAQEAEIASLRAECQRPKLMDALLAAMQADAVTYLVPDNDCGADWFVSRMLRHLDGPQQREAQNATTNDRHQKDTE